MTVERNKVQDLPIIIVKITEENICPKGKVFGVTHYLIVVSFLLIDIYSSTIILHIYRLITMLEDTSRLFWCGLCCWDKFIILKY